QGPDHPDRRARHAGRDGAGSPDHRLALRRDSRRGAPRGDPAQLQGAGGVPQDVSATAPSTTPLVRVDGIHTFYGKSHILHGGSLDVMPGEVVGLLGRNGVGKSTTLKTVMGLVHPTEGTVSLDGRPITRLPAYRLARLGIGYVPEDRRIFRLLTVSENLRTGLDRHGVTEERKPTLLGTGYPYLPPPPDPPTHP